MYNGVLMRQSVGSAERINLQLFLQTNNKGCSQLILRHEFQKPVSLGIRI